MVGALHPLLSANELRTRVLGMSKLREWLMGPAYSGVSMKVDADIVATATGKKNKQRERGEEADWEAEMQEGEGDSTASTGNNHAKGDKKPVPKGMYFNGLVNLKPIEPSDYHKLFEDTPISKHIRSGAGQDSGDDDDDDAEGGVTKRTDYNEVTRADMLKICDGLLFHLWMCDGREPQAQLAHDISRLLLDIADIDLGALMLLCCVVCVYCVLLCVCWVCAAVCMLLCVHVCACVCMCVHVCTFAC